MPESSATCGTAYQAHRAGPFAQNLAGGRWARNLNRPPARAGHRDGHPAVRPGTGGLRGDPGRHRGRGQGLPRLPRRRGIPPRRRRGRRVPDRLPLRLARPPAQLAGLRRAPWMTRRATRRRPDAHPGAHRAGGLGSPSHSARRAPAVPYEMAIRHLGDDLPSSRWSSPCRRLCSGRCRWFPGSRWRRWRPRRW